MLIEMPRGTTHHGSKAELTKNEKAKVKSLTKTTKATTTRPTKDKELQGHKETVHKVGEKEDASDRLVRKVKEKRLKAGKSDKIENTPRKRLHSKSPVQTDTFEFQGEDNIMEIEVSKVVQQQEFPSPSEDEEDSDPEDGELLDNTNVNSTGTQLLGASRSTGQLQQAPSFPEEGPSTSSGKRESTNLNKMLTIMQKLMVKKGLIDVSLTAEELEQLIEDEEGVPSSQECPPTCSPAKKKRPDPKQKQRKEWGRDKDTEVDKVNSLTSPSDITIYKRAVQQIAPGLEDKIDKFVTDACKSVEIELRKRSTSSDEFFDTSDESNDINPFNFNIVAEKTNQQTRRKTR